MMKLVTLLLTLVLATTASAGSPDLTLSGETDDSWAVAVFFTSLAAISEDRQEVTVDIDSPGGYVTSGIQVVQLMEAGKKLGLAYKCRVTGKAMSAAFLVLSACSERSAVRTAKLMWHGAWGTFRIVDLWPRTAELDAELEQAYEAQVLMNNYVAEATRVPWAKWLPKFDEEYVFSAVEFAEFAPGFMSVLTK